MQKQKTALVTGAAGGIGVETCKLLASKGYNLILVDNDFDRLQYLAKSLSVDTLVIVCDVREEVQVKKAIR